MDDTLREFVKQRADRRCEYCHMPQEYDVLPFQIDHIIALKHPFPGAAEHHLLNFC